MGPALTIHESRARHESSSRIRTQNRPCAIAEGENAPPQTAPPLCQAGCGGFSPPAAGADREPSPAASALPVKGDGARLFPSGAKRGGGVRCRERSPAILRDEAPSDPTTAPLVNGNAKETAWPRLSQVVALVAESEREPGKCSSPDAATLSVQGRD
jgi:hypothetical protein